MPPKAKRQSAHQHDRRHETGLAQPGRRISKQRSAGHLNENVPVQSRSKSQLTTVATQPEVSRANSTAYASGPDESIKQTHVRPTPLHVGAAQAEGQIRASSEVSFDGLEDGQLSDDNFEDSASLSYQNISAKKLSSVHGGRTLQSITAIISICPLRDVIAILIILLQLPPTILTVIQFLFSTLTFLPPTSIATLPSVSEILAGSGGMPSLATMIVTDLIILLVWLLMWVPAQNLVLDLAQAVIAIALGGAAAGKGGTTHSIVVCLTVILLSHSIRSKPARNYGMSLLWSQFGQRGVDYPTAAPSSDWFAETLYIPRSWPRSILGIHILTQGLVRVVRRALARKEPTKPSKAGKRSESENVDDSRLSRSSSISTDLNVDTTASSDGDRRQSGTAINLKEGKEKSINLKKRRKPANAVRMRQPFWAALASTKITICKEIENREAIADAIEANTTSISDVADSNFALGEGRFWISDISATTISFGACMEDYDDTFAIEMGADRSDINDKVGANSPFHVRVNGAQWASSKIQHVGNGGNDEQWNIWAGEVSGLTPLSSYRCEFVRSIDSDVLYVVNVVTNAAASTEKGKQGRSFSVQSIITEPYLDKITAPSVTEPLRPSSPLSTLKKSTAAAEQKIQEYRNRLKRTRKDHKLAISSLKKEVENLTSRKSSTIGNDDKLRQRELQLQQHIQHLENATSSVAAEIDALGHIPEEDRIKADEAKARWEAARDANAASRAEFDASRRKNDNELDAVRGEVASALQKRDRLQARRTKLTEQHDRLVTKNSEDAENRARIANQIAAQDAHRANVESQYIASIETCERQTLELTQKTHAAAQQLQQIESLITQQQKQQQHLQQAAAMPPAFTSLSQATTSEGLFSVPTSADAVAVAATSNNNLVDRSPTTSSLRAFNFPAVFEPYIATTPPRTSNGVSQPMGNNYAAVGTSTAAGAGAGIAGTTRSRLRSSSMLSAISNFTDDFDPPAPWSGAGAGTTTAAIGTSRPKSSVIGDTPLVTPTTMSRNDSAVVAAKEQLKSGRGSVKMSKAIMKPVSEPFGNSNDKGHDSVVSDDADRDDAATAGNDAGHVNATFGNGNTLANKSW